jgi:integrase
LGTGIRPGALVGLNREDVDLRSGTLQIRLKGGTEGRVFLNPEPGDSLGPISRRKRHTGQHRAKQAAFSRPIEQAIERPANPIPVRLFVSGSGN